MRKNLFVNVTVVCNFQRAKLFGNTQKTSFIKFFLLIYCKVYESQNSNKQQKICPCCLKFSKIPVLKIK